MALRLGKQGKPVASRECLCDQIIANESEISRGCGDKRLPNWFLKHWRSVLTGGRQLQLLAPWRPQARKAPSGSCSENVSLNKQRGREKR